MGLSGDSENKKVWYRPYNEVRTNAPISDPEEALKNINAYQIRNIKQKLLERAEELLEKKDSEPSSVSPLELESISIAVKNAKEL